VTGTEPGSGLRARRLEVIARRDLRGGDLCRALAAITDVWLREIFAAAVGPDEHTVALLAVGGYGRRELAPGSDLDLVLVHRNRSDIGRVAEAVWYPIWDEGVALDHSVRTAREVGTAMDADLRVALGLLDVRTVAGSAPLGDEIRRAALDKWAGRAKRWLPEVAETVEARHASAGDLAFLLQPDLKESRGGLRDLAQLTALAGVTPVLADLVAEGRLDGPAETLTAARVELQRATGRSANRLSLQDQDTVAAALGIDADALMAGLAHAGRTVAWASDDAWRRIRVLLAGGRRSRQWAPRPLEPGLALRRGEVTLLPGADPGTDPALALRAGAVSAELDIPLARETIDALAGSAAAPAGSEDPQQGLAQVLGPDAGRRSVPPRRPASGPRTCARPCCGSSEPAGRRSPPSRRSTSRACWNVSCPSGARCATGRSATPTTASPWTATSSKPSPMPPIWCGGWRGPTSSCSVRCSTTSARAGPVTTPRSGWASSPMSDRASVCRPPM
jgi:[protein-PII] uridylyltransferase